MRGIHRVGQRDGEALAQLSLTRENTRIRLLGNDGVWRRLVATAYECEQEKVAPAGRGYGSATTNGLPPSLALSEGRTATASALVAYSPTRTL